MEEKQPQYFVLGTAAEAFANATDYKLINDAIQWHQIRTCIYLTCITWLLILLGFANLSGRKGRGNDLPLANPSGILTPRFIKYKQWTSNARDILVRANRRFGKDTVYRIDRGDIELVVVPRTLIPELNLLPETVVNSRSAHAFNLVGNQTGMRVVTKTILHFQVIQHKLTPALPKLAGPMRDRLNLSISRAFSSSGNSWRTVKPLDALSTAVCEVTAMITVGKPLCDSDDYVAALSTHFRNVFETVCMLRMCPRSLRSLVGYLLPVRRRCAASLRRIESHIIPEIERRRTVPGAFDSLDALSWMVQKAQGEEEREPYFLSELQAVTASGATITTASLAVTTLCDLVAHPEVLEEIREEIAKLDVEIDGHWDYAAFQRLHKLESALKESMRVNPPIMVLYNRMILQDVVLSSGVQLQKGQIICSLTPLLESESESDIGASKYDGLRSYREDYERHIARPLRSLDDFAWGSGRGACPGRFIASLEVKMVVAKLVNDFDWRYPDSRAPPRMESFCELRFLRPDVQLTVRQRAGVAQGAGLYARSS